MIPGLSTLSNAVKMVVFAVVAVIIALASIQAYKSWNTVARFFGFETTQTLKEDLKEAKRDIQEATDANTSLQTGNQILKDAEVIRSDVVKDLDTAKVLIDKNADKVKKDTAVEIEKIKTNLELDEIQKINATSRARLLGVWKLYCSKKVDPECLQASTQGPL